MKTLALCTLVTWAALTGTTLHITHTPCATEDSTMCFWDAAAHGNGTGTSFIALTDSLTFHTR